MSENWEDRVAKHDPKHIQKTVYILKRQVKIINKLLEADAYLSASDIVRQSLDRFLSDEYNIALHKNEDRVHEEIVKNIEAKKQWNL